LKISFTTSLDQLVVWLCRTEVIDFTYPGVDLTLVTIHHRGNVVLHDIDQSCFVPDGRDPRRELGVPHLASLASHIVICLDYMSSRTYQEYGHESASHLTEQS
jgi:hypothetical protein